MITCCKHSENADGAMAGDLSDSECGTRLPYEPEPRMSTADAAALVDAAPGYHTTGTIPLSVMRPSFVTSFTPSTRAVATMMRSPGVEENHPSTVHSSPRGSTMSDR